MIWSQRRSLSSLRILKAISNTLSSTDQIDSETFPLSFHLSSSVMLKLLLLFVALPSFRIWAASRFIFLETSAILTRHKCIISVWKVTLFMHDESQLWPTTNCGQIPRPTKRLRNSLAPSNKDSRTNKNPIQEKYIYFNCWSINSEEFNPSPRYNEQNIEGVVYQDLENYEHFDPRCVACMCTVSLSRVPTSC